MAEANAFDHRQLFESAPCGYAVVDERGVVQLANAWLANVLALPGEAVEGRRLNDILSMPGRILFETNLAPLLRMQGSFSEVTLDLRRSDGKSVPVIVAAAVLDEAVGKAIRFQIVFMHAGERRLYERELLNARDVAERGMKEYREDGELREQFVAVLGHDLRNPLASITAALRILAREDLSDRGRQVLALMQASAARMAGLIENILDFARARLGSGIALDLKAGHAVEPILEQVVAELRISNPDKKIETLYAIEGPVSCDGAKIGQLVSNLLGNAIAHGDKVRPIRLHAETSADGCFRLSVSNGGRRIPEEVLPKLFEPFVRGRSHGYREGLGLGLYIASEIAKAHNGSLSVASSEDETRFTFEMPCS